MGKTAKIVPTAALPEEVLRAVLAKLRRGERVALATVIGRRGSSPSTPGQKLALLDAGSALGTVGGGAVESQVIDAMQTAFSERETQLRVLTFDLGPEMGMRCGGAAEVLIEVIDPAVTALIVGAGHIGAAVAPLLATVGFRVVIVDSRPAAVDAARLAPGPRLEVLATDHGDAAVLSAVGADHARAAALVMTHDHKLDQRVIEWALGERFALVGGVGSRAKAAGMREELRAKDFAEADIERVQMPLGVDIGARGPEEIAISITAELVRWRSRLLRDR